MKIFKLICQILITIICIIGCVQSLLFADRCYTEYVGYESRPDLLEPTEYKYYTGDAYTGLQNAAADASNNAFVIGVILNDVGEMIEKNSACVVEDICYLTETICTLTAIAFAIMTIKNSVVVSNIIKEIVEEQKKRKAMLTIASEQEETCIMSQ